MSGTAVYTRADIDRMIALLGECETVVEAEARLGWGKGRLRSAFILRGLGPPGRYLRPRQRLAESWAAARAPEPVLASARPTPPAAAQPPQPAVAPRVQQLAPAQQPPIGDAVAGLVAYCRARPRTLEQCCDHLGLPPGRVRGLLAQAREAGHTVAVAGDAVAWEQPEHLAGQVEVPLVARSVGEPHRIAVVSDPHFGSRYCMRAELADFMGQAYAGGCRLCLVPGDILDGCYEHGRWELSHHGLDEQMADACESLPQLDGLRYLFVDGNHDETYWRQTGALTGPLLVQHFAAQGRRDLEYLGPRQGKALLRSPASPRPIVVELWHPKPGKAYAVSYQAQKRIESYAPGTKPDVLLCGHWHTFVYFEQRGVHAIACGTFQSGESSFAKSLAGSVSTGGQILSLHLTAAGTLRRVGVDRLSYYVAEHSREVAL